MANACPGAGQFRRFKCINTYMVVGEDTELYVEATIGGDEVD